MFENFRANVLKEGNTYYDNSHYILPSGPLKTKDIE